MVKPFEQAKNQRKAILIRQHLMIYLGNYDTTLKSTDLCKCFSRSTGDKPKG